MSKLLITTAQYRLQTCKITEKCSMNRTMSFLLKHKISYDKQHSFQENKSTTRALIDIAYQIYNIFNNKMKCEGSHKKVFDTITKF